ncbi:MAG: LytR/AlgR family response regulator transcription factor [Ruminiclostridium sp.]
MNYIICDDSIKFSEELKQRILKEEPDSTVTVFNSISALKFNLVDIADKIDGLFMDIKNCDGNGIEASAEIAKKYPSLKIIYVTGYGMEFSQAIFDFQGAPSPTAYLIKPVEDKYLHSALQKLKNNTNSDNDYISIKQNRRIVFIYLRDIISVSCDRRKLTIHTAENDIEFYEKMSDFEEKLSPDFARCHKSYIVNMNYIDSIENWVTVVMKDGTKFPVGRSYREDFKNAVIRRSSAEQIKK